MRGSKGTPTLAEMDKIVRAYGGRPMTKNESAEFGRFFKGSVTKD